MSKKYHPEEKPVRMGVWSANVARIDNHNAQAAAGNQSYTMAENDMCDQVFRFVPVFLIINLIHRMDSCYRLLRKWQLGWDPLRRMMLTKTAHRISTFKRSTCVPPCQLLTIWDLTVVCLVLKIKADVGLAGPSVPLILSNIFNARRLALSHSLGKFPDHLKLICSDLIRSFVFYLANSSW